VTSRGQQVVPTSSSCRRRWHQCSRCLLSMWHQVARSTLLTLLTS
jgi:hypothetical protein